MEGNRRFGSSKGIGLSDGVEGERDGVIGDKDGVEMERLGVARDMGLNDGVAGDARAALKGVDATGRARENLGDAAGARG